MASALSPQNREEIVMTDILLSFILHPVQCTEVRLTPLEEKEAVMNEPRLCSHSELLTLLLCSETIWLSASIKLPFLFLMNIVKISSIPSYCNHSKPDFKPSPCFSCDNFSLESSNIFLHEVYLLKNFYCYI